MVDQKQSVLITKECIEHVDPVALCKCYSALDFRPTPHEDGVLLTFMTGDLAAGFFTGFHMAHPGQRVYYERDEEHDRTVMKLGAEGKGWKTPPILLRVV